MKFLYALFFLSSTCSLYAQIDFAPPGAVYRYLYEQQSGSEHQYSEFFVVEIEVIGDTIIQDHHCSILAGEGLSYTWLWECGALNQERIFVYEEEGKAYYYHQATDSFRIYHDFNAMPGESWIMNTNCETMHGCYDSLTTMTVDSLKTEVINGQTIDVQYVLGRKIYRNIGLDGPMFHFKRWSCSTIHLYLRGLRCYTDPSLGDFEFYDDLGDCTEYLTPASEPLAARSLIIFPNPTIDQVQLTAETAFRWELFTPSGRSITVPSTYATSVALPLDGRPAGLYYVRITFREGGSVVRKLVKF